MRDDDGVGLAEIVVALFILTLMSIVMITVFLNGIKLSAQNSTNAAANEYASQQVELARSRATCADVTTWATPATSTTTDARGVVLTATRTAGACATGDTYPETIAVTISVKRADTNKVVSTATSRVYLTSYS